MKQSKEYSRYKIRYHLRSIYKIDNLREIRIGFSISCDYGLKQYLYVSRYGRQ